MNTEQLLINKWRSLNSEQQRQVLDFVEFVAQESLFIDCSQIKQQRVRQWLDWAGDSPNDSLELPDEALSRDSIYSED